MSWTTTKYRFMCLECGEVITSASFDVSRNDGIDHLIDCHADHPTPLDITFAAIYPTDNPDAAKP